MARAASSRDRVCSSEGSMPVIAVTSSGIFRDRAESKFTNSLVFTASFESL